MHFFFFFVRMRRFLLTLKTINILLFYSIFARNFVKSVNVRYILFCRADN